MSTRSAIVFRIDQRDIAIQYVHNDGYPAGVGATIVQFVSRLRDSTGPIDSSDCEGATNTLSLNEYCEKCRTLRIVKDDKEVDRPTPADKKRYKKLGDSGVNGGDGWYSLLRLLQGDPKRTLDEGVCLDAGVGWLRSSVFCEYAYVINFDTCEVEFYRGFQEKRHKKGRYASLPADTSGLDPFYPVALVSTFKFTETPNWGKED